MKAVLLFTFISFLGCSTGPSKYVLSKGESGYSDTMIDNNLRLAMFKGNSSTKKENAELYAKFRAMEICQDLGSAYTHILQVRDKTYSKEITQTTTNTPNYYYGTSPYYGRYGYGDAGTRSWNETYIYPLFEVYFECTDRPLDSRISFKILSQSQMQSLVKDLKGAVQIDKVLSDSPNLVKLKDGDIIIRAGGSRVETIIELYQARKRSKTENFKVEFFRNGVKKEALVRFLDVTEMVDQAQNEIIKSACKIEEIKKERPLCGGKKLRGS